LSKIVLRFLTKLVLQKCVHELLPNKQQSLVNYVRVLCTNVDQNLIADQRNSRAKYLQNGEEN